MKKKNIVSLLVITLCLQLFYFSSYAQKSKKDDDHKSKIITTDAGVKYYIHTVEKGQTLFAIAKIYDKTVNDIVLENPEAIDGVKPGQIIKIPFDKPKPKAKPKEVEKEIPKEIVTMDSSKFIFHKVEKGQTFYSITHQYKISEEKLKLNNPELSEGLKIGQTIKIPKEPGAIEKLTDNKNKREVKKDNMQKVAIENVPQQVQKEVIKDSVTFIAENYPSKIKESYNVAFFLPFHAEDANAMDIEKLQKGEEQFDNKTTVALQFYEGAMLAIDSLKKQKLNVKIFVYDIDEHDSTNIINLTKKPELATIDLMIGPLYSSGFMLISKYAKEHKIPIISPFIQVNKILFQNKYVCKVQPSVSLQIEEIASFIVDSFAKQNIVLVDNGFAKDAASMNFFKNKFSKKLVEKNYPATDTAKIVKGLTGVEGLLNPNKTNVVILVSGTQSYVTEFIRGLSMNSDKNKIVLFGMQSWMGYDNMDFDYLNKLSVHVPSNSFVDYGNEGVKNIIKTYRNKYSTEPEMYVYQGFDVSYYFISQLQKYGTGFLQHITTENFAGVETGYRFAQFPGDSGFENNFVHILKYYDFKLQTARK